MADENGASRIVLEAPSRKARLAPAPFRAEPGASAHKPVYAFGRMRSRSLHFAELFALVERLAPSSFPMLLEGESGTGKQLLAREIHTHSRASAGPFELLRCSAFAPHVTCNHVPRPDGGDEAFDDRCLEGMSGGTIFLDEVAYVPVVLQAKLAGILEPQGAPHLAAAERRGPVRVLAATRFNLSELVQLGRFREDLYYRLCAVPIRLPPLRSRLDDIELLASHFLERFAARHQRPAPTLGADVLSLLRAFHWPGNVRELESAMEHAAVVAKEPTLRPEDLPSDLRCSTAKKRHR